MSPRSILFILLVTAVFAYQRPRDIPRYEGDGNRMHDGQPAWCQNKEVNGYRANCACARSCDRDDRGSDCKTWCRTPRCKCDHGCPRTQ